MGTQSRRLVQIGAVLAISSMALVGCSSTINDPAPTSSSSAKATQKATKPATKDGAAAFANDFFATLISEDTTDYSKLTPPVELSDDQAQQLLLDGKVDGVSDEKLEELVNFLYKNNPVGKYLYFSKDASIQERLQAISALMLAQQYASGSLSEDQTPKKITAEDVTLSKSGKLPTASFTGTDGELAPLLVFVNEEWKIDGAALLDSFGVSSSEATSSAEATPSEN